MRVIIFKGKRIDNGLWIEGCLRQYLNGHAGICCNKTQHLFKVDPETVGQYTGLKDRNEQRIFEWDFVRADLMFGGHETGCYALGYVVYADDGFKLRVTLSHNAKEHAEYTEKEQCEYYLDHNFLKRNYKLQIIGNIHDNPELLEEKTK